MSIKSRNQREGHFAGKFLRRYRRAKFRTPKNRYYVYESRGSDFICTRAQCRADKLERSQIARGVLPQPEEVDWPF